MGLQYKVDDRLNVRFLTVSGELDISNCREFQQLLRATAETCDRLILRLEASCFDSETFKVLFAEVMEIKKTSSVKLDIIVGSSAVRRVIDILDPSRILGVYIENEDALGQNLE